ncbi:mannosyl-oligosaccharide 1,2-alpha-mannosidase [Pelomyxa schiedti]|nr:mannosyl-oligosaccharide 1,2-alpha-mannosidase [Pelomyxa schiedti]
MSTPPEYDLEAGVPYDVPSHGVNATGKKQQPTPTRARKTATSGAKRAGRVHQNHGQAAAAQHGGRWRSHAAAANNDGEGDAGGEGCYRKPGRFLFGFVLLALVLFLLVAWSRGRVGDTPTVNVILGPPAALVTVSKSEKQGTELPLPTPPAVDPDPQEEEPEGAVQSGRLPPVGEPPRVTPPPPIAQPPPVAVPPKLSEQEIARMTLIEEHRASVVKGMRDAWEAYSRFAWGQDDLLPVTHSGSSWLHLGITIVDSLDTLWIMGMRDEFKKAREWVANNLDLSPWNEVSLFETNIRALGGLLSAYDLSKDDLFLTKAQDLAHRFLPAFDSPTGIPYTSINLRSGSARNPGNNGYTILSEAGTLQLEFVYAAKHAKDPELKTKALRVIDKIEAAEKVNGLYPVYIHPSNGRFDENSPITLGALGDSFYEYLLKLWLLFGGPGTEGDKYRKIYDAAMTNVVDKMVQVSSPSGLTYIADMRWSSLDHKMDELACFAGGMFALGAVRHNSTEHPNPNSNVHFKLGKEIGRTCHEMWKRMPSGIAPEFVVFSPGSDFSAGASHFLLRPETAETFFILWRLTHDPIYQDWGWEIWQAIDKHCRCNGGGYSGLRSVTSTSPEKDNNQPSYFLAETLKYLYLLFSPDDVIPLDKYVFTTEAHPLSIFQ